MAKLATSERLIQLLNSQPDINFAGLCQHFSDGEPILAVHSGRIQIAKHDLRKILLILGGVALLIAVLLILGEDFARGASGGMNIIVIIIGLISIPFAIKNMGKRETTILTPTQFIILSGVRPESNHPKVEGVAHISLSQVKSVKNSFWMGGVIIKLNDGTTVALQQDKNRRAWPEKMMGKAGMANTMQQLLGSHQ